MPIVTIQVTREGTEPGVDRSRRREGGPDQRRQRLLLDVLNKPLN